MFWEGLEYVGQDPWVELEDVIRAQLELQVRLSLDRHHRFMVEHGLGQCRHVVDVGTGNGLFLRGVAQRHPAIHFTGLDDKPHMVAEARSGDGGSAAFGQEARSGAGASVDWVQADALSERAQEVLSTANGVLMRYFVLHMHDTNVTIPSILRSVPVGSRLWVFDLDTDYCACDPADDAYTAFMDLVRSFCSKNSVEIRTGTRLPPILESAGFRVDAVAVEPFDNREIGPEAFSEYILREATLYQYFLDGTPDSDRLDRLRHFLSQVMRPDTHFVRYGMAMVGATKVAQPVA